MKSQIDLNAYNVSKKPSKSFAGWFQTIHGGFETWPDCKVEIPSLGFGVLSYAGLVVAIVWKLPRRSDWRGKVFRYTPDSDAVDEPFWVSGRSKGKCLQAAKFYHSGAYSKGGEAPSPESVVKW
jgi:hypothetical protein